MQDCAILCNIGGQKAPERESEHEFRAFCTKQNNPNIEFDSSTLLSEAIIGAFAGGLGAFLTNPTDVITTRIITQDTSGGTNGDGGDAPLGVIDMGKKIYNEEGAEAFFTGWTARVAYWAPAISIFLTCYCSVRRAGIYYDWFP